MEEPPEAPALGPSRADEGCAKARRPYSYPQGLETKRKAHKQMNNCALTWRAL